MGKTAWVYILTNKREGVLYVGVTSDLSGRMAKHKPEELHRALQRGQNRVR